MGQVGDRLRQAREAKGLTLEEVEEITKIRCRYLQALEEEDYGQFPGEVFIRGFLRNYAQALDLDPDEVLAAAGRKVPDPVRSVEAAQGATLDKPPAQEAGSQRLISALIGVVALVGVLLGGWALYHYLGPSRIPPTLPPPSTEGTPTSAVHEQATSRPTLTPSPSITPKATAAATAMATATATSEPTPTVAPTDTPEPTIAPSPAAGEAVVLRLETLADSWIRVEVDGAVVFEDTLRPGQVMEWRGESEIHLLTGNAGGLRVWYNGQEEPQLGASGEVLERTWQAGPQVPTEEQPPAEGTPEAETTPEPLGPPPEPGE